LGKTNDGFESAIGHWTDIFGAIDQRIVQAPHPD
jgi:hypothetical protein